MINKIKSCKRKHLHILICMSKSEICNFSSFSFKSSKASFQLAIKRFSLSLIKFLKIFLQFVYVCVLFAIPGKYNLEFLKSYCICVLKLICFTYLLIGKIFHRLGPCCMCLKHNFSSTSRVRHGETH